MSDWRDTGAGNMKSQKTSATFQHMIQFQHMCVFDPLTALEAVLQPRATSSPISTAPVGARRGATAGHHRSTELGNTDQQNWAS